MLDSCTICKGLHVRTLYWFALFYASAFILCKRRANISKLEVLLLLLKLTSILYQNQKTVYLGLMMVAFF
jgi:hypothetical protein